MIQAVVVINNSGKARLMKFYGSIVGPRQSKDQKAHIVSSLFKACSKRTEASCNFIDDPSIVGSEYKIIYRQYATLYIIFIADEAESELAILDMIQVFVEVLDKCFSNVCELDLIFNPQKCHALLDEIVMGGVVVEPAIGEIWRTVDALTKYEKTS